LRSAAGATDASGAADEPRLARPQSRGREESARHSSRSLVSRVLAVAAVALAAAAVAAPTGSATGQHSIAQPAGTLPYQNPMLPVDQRVQDLLSRITLAEKIGQMTQAERASVDTDTSSRARPAIYRIPTACGQPPSTFAGDGLTTYGTGSNMQTTGNYPIDQGVDQVDHATFDRLALSPYVAAVRDHQVGSVMPSYSDVDWTEDGLGNRINMHGNRDLITGWLKDTIGFDGFVISDYNGIDHIDPGSTFAHQVAAGVNAGIDMFMQPQNFEQFRGDVD